MEDDNDVYMEDERDAGIVESEEEGEDLLEDMEKYDIQYDLNIFTIEIMREKQSQIIMSKMVLMMKNRRSQTSMREEKQREDSMRKPSIVKETSLESQEHSWMMRMSFQRRMSCRDKLDSRE